MEMSVQCLDNIGGFSIFRFVRYFTVGIVLEKHWQLADTVWSFLRKRHVLTCIFGKSKPLRVHRNSNLSNLPLPLFFLSCSGFIQHHHLCLSPSIPTLCGALNDFLGGWIFPFSIEICSATQRPSDLTLKGVQVVPKIEAFCQKWPTSTWHGQFWSWWVATLGGGCFVFFSFGPRRHLILAF